MPNWGEVQKEILTVPVRRVVPEPGPLDIVRRKYLKELSKLTKRNVIAYYSGFLQRPEMTIHSSIFDGDVNALMNVVHQLDRAKGLDLILHTPGGMVAATEAIVNYLHAIFGNDIRCFIPQLAMSGGTMIACACKEIIMGRQSSIGPIDPQINGIPAYGVIEDYERAVQEIATNPSSIPIWQTLFSRLTPSVISECHRAIKLSGDLVEKWLVKNMFSNSKTPWKEAKRMVEALNNYADTKTHARHFNYEWARNIGLKVKLLEDDNQLQDLVLTVHHAFMETFNQARVLKVVENQNGIAT